MSAPLSDSQGYQLVRVGKKWKLPVDLQKLIWADVTGRYHRRHGRWGQFGLPVIEKAHVVGTVSPMHGVPELSLYFTPPRTLRAVSGHVCERDALGIARHR